MQPDTIVPGAGNPQSWNRYSYTLNNPINLNDPTGHMQEDDDDDGCGKPNCGLPLPIPIKESNHPNHELHQENDEMSIVLLQNPGFDPFTGVFSDPSEYYGSEAEDIDIAFRNLYDSLGVDMDYYASNGLPNPVSVDQVPTELLHRLIGNAQSIPLTFFLNEVGIMPTSISMDYEPNYVYSLMLSHPNSLMYAIDRYNIEVAPLMRDIAEHGPPSPRAPEAPKGYYGPE